MLNKKSIISLILIVLGVLTIFPLFINFLYANSSYDGETTKIAGELFDLKSNEVEDGKFFWTLTKIGAIVAAVAGVVIAALEIAKFLNIDLGPIEKLVALVAVVAGLLVLVCFLIFCIMNTETYKNLYSDETYKVFPSGAIGWYLSWIPALLAGGLALKAPQDW